MRWVLAKQSRGKKTPTITSPRSQLDFPLHLSSLTCVDRSIALLVSRPSMDEKCKTTLICTPVALLGQWATEIRTKTSPQLDVYIHHTSTRGRRARTSSELQTHDVVLTTYATIANEWKALNKWKYPPEDVPPDTLDKPRTMFLETKWYRVILDESQVIKNRSTLSANGTCGLDAEYRWSLSGTPMQNGVHEMYSQFSFLRIRP